MAERNDMTDELIFKGNEYIDESVHRYYQDQCSDTVMALLSAVYGRIIDGAQFLTPCDKVENDDGTFNFKTVELDNGATALVAFTSIKNLLLGPETDYTANYISMIFQAVLENDAISGVLLNPWHEPFLFTKDIIKLFFKPNDVM